MQDSPLTDYFLGLVIIGFPVGWGRHDVERPIICRLMPNHNICILLSLPGASIGLILSFIHSWTPPWKGFWRCNLCFPSWPVRFSPLAIIFWWFIPFILVPEHKHTIVSGYWSFHVLGHQVLPPVTTIWSRVPSSRIHSLVFWYYVRCVIPVTAGWRPFPTLTSQKLLLRKPQIIIFYYRVIGLRIFPPKTPKETIKSIIFNF